MKVIIRIEITKICEKHFNLDQFSGNKRLKESAVPSVVGLRKSISSACIKEEHCYYAYAASEFESDNKANLQWSQNQICNNALELNEQLMKYLDGSAWDDYKWNLQNDNVQLNVEVESVERVENNDFQFLKADCTCDNNLVNKTDAIKMNDIHPTLKLSKLEYTL